MYRIYHFCLCPFSRKLRFFLCEKGIKFSLEILNPWIDAEKLTRFDKFARLPILVEEGNVMMESNSICEYLQEISPDQDCNLVGENPEDRKIVRRSIMFFEKNFYYEVVRPICHEKVAKYFYNLPPNSRYLREALSSLKHYLKQIQEDLLRSGWIGKTEYFSLADITAAANISILDYLGHIEWQELQVLKRWYLLVKSRPAFHPILSDYLRGFSPPEHYDLCDY